MKLKIFRYTVTTLIVIWPCLGFGDPETESVSTAPAAVKGEMPDPTGETYGVVGVSNSPGGAGLGAANTAGGPDLVLDGAEDGETDALVSQDGIVLSSSGHETFTFENTGGGDMHLAVIGTIHGNGSGLVDVDAETLDGIDSSAFSPLVHLHDDRYYTELELSTSGGGGSVHWDNLSTVPFGLNDGDDDTTYTAGTGLRLVSTEFRSMGTGFSNVVVVASDGGDYPGIQEAIDNISDATATKPYLVWVAPGEYPEVVTMKPHVHLQGAGRRVSMITGAAGTWSWPPDIATLRLVSESSVRDLTVRNPGQGFGMTVGVIADAGVTETRMADVAVEALGTGIFNCGVYLSGSSTEVALDGVDSNGDGANSTNYGLVVSAGASATLTGGAYTGHGGPSGDGVGIRVEGAGTTFVASDASALGENAGSENFGLRHVDGATATLHGGSYTGRGGNSAAGVGVYNSALEAVGVSAIGEGAATQNRGLHSAAGTETITVRGGAAFGRGGAEAYGIWHFNGTLRATNHITVAENGTSNIGVRVMNGAVYLGATQVGGGVTNTFGTLVCFQVYDDLFAPYSCPP
jgi:hypothetical protein